MKKVQGIVYCSRRCHATNCAKDLPEQGFFGGVRGHFRCHMKHPSRRARDLLNNIYTLRAGDWSRDVHVDAHQLPSELQ